MNCALCGQVNFLSQHSLARHCEEHQSKQSIRVCPECKSDDFPNACFMLHIKERHPENCLWCFTPNSGHIHECCQHEYLDLVKFLLQQ